MACVPPFLFGLLVVVAVFLLPTPSSSIVPDRPWRHGGDAVGSTVLGIDLGTTHSCVAVYRDGRVEIVPNERGNRVTPSWVALTDDGGWVIGEEAKSQAAGNQNRTIFDAKRLIGKMLRDADVQREMKRLPFTVVDKDGFPYVRVQRADDGDARLLSAEEISAMVLAKMKETAEAYLGREVTRAVITVPAYFNDAQRQATKGAAMLAGLDVIRIVNEPTAAAVAYNLNGKRSTVRHFLVFDLGGGTFDVTVMIVEDGIFEVLATNGESHLGGDDFDRRVVNHFVELIKRKHGMDVTVDGRALHRLRHECERAKRALSSQHEARVEIEALLVGVDLSESLTRAQFEELNEDLFLKIMAPLEKAIADAELDNGDIDEIILVGGSTRIPRVLQLVKGYFDGKEPSKGMNPDEAVAYGAAVVANLLTGGDDELVRRDRGPQDWYSNNHMHRAIRVETSGGATAVVIPKRRRFPTTETHVFTTYLGARQKAVTIKVFEGESSTEWDNKFLGELELTGIPPASIWNWGWRPINVTVEVDELGDLHVEATDKASGKSEKLFVFQGHGYGRLSKEEIDRLVREAEEHAEEDRRVRERIEALNKMEAYVYDVKNAVVGAGETEGEDKVKAEEAARTAIEWLDGNPGAEKGDYEVKLKELEDSCGPFMSAVRGRSERSHDEL